MEVRSILFPVDSSARCYAAVPCVAAMARLFDASIYLLRPAKDPPPDLNFEGLRVVPAIRYGNADDEITNFATTRHIGMIMMATYSQEVFNALSGLDGSSSERRCAAAGAGNPQSSLRYRPWPSKPFAGAGGRIRGRASRSQGPPGLCSRRRGKRNRAGRRNRIRTLYQRLRQSFRGAPAARDRHLIRSVHGDRMAIARDRGRGAAPRGRPRNHGTRRY